MAQATFSVRMDENLKRQFDILCADFGMNASTAFTVFAKAVVRERRIPLRYHRRALSVTRADGLQALNALREEARENGVQGMTLDEINAEIAATRAAENEA